MFACSAWVALATVLASACGPAPAPVPPNAIPTATPRQPTEAVAASLIDQRLRRAWPDDRQGPAWFTEAGYRLLARHPGEFVAVRAPTIGLVDDARVSAAFRKVGGPPGGGYGLIVHDKRASLGDGVDQGGQFVVAATGDRGEFGVWRRDAQHWIDLVPWTGSPLVHVGDVPNELTVHVHGERLQFDVNGGRVADVPAPLAPGGIGLFVGGDLNEVLVERLVVERLPTAPPTAAALEDQDLAAARARLQALSERAQQAQSSGTSPTDQWQREVSDVLVAVQQLGGDVAATASNAQADRQRVARVQALLAALEQDAVGLLDVWRDGFTGPRSPVENPEALRQARNRLQHATTTAEQLRGELDALRAGRDGSQRR